MLNDWQSFYSKEASVYDSHRYLSWYGRLFSRLQHQAITQVLPKDIRNGTILEIASGTGHNLPILMANAQRVIASDLAPAMLNIARKKFPETNVSYIINDAFHLPYADNQFDAVASFRFLHLFPPSKQKSVIIEMRRVLRPGGYLIVDFYNQRHWQLLFPIIQLYRLTTHKRPTRDTYNQIQKVCSMLTNTGLEVKHIKGVGSYLLAACRLLPFHLAVSIGHIFQKPFLRIFAEQFLICAQKQK